MQSRWKRSDDKKYESNTREHHYPWYGWTTVQGVSKLECRHIFIHYRFREVVGSEDFRRAVFCKIRARSRSAALDALDPVAPVGLEDDTRGIMLDDERPVTSSLRLLLSRSAMSFCAFCHSSFAANRVSSVSAESFNVSGSP